MAENRVMPDSWYDAGALAKRIGVPEPESDYGQRTLLCVADETWEALEEGYYNVDTPNMIAEGNISSFTYVRMEQLTDLVEESEEIAALDAVPGSLTDHVGEVLCEVLRGLVYVLAAEYEEHKEEYETDPE